MEYFMVLGVAYAVLVAYRVYKMWQAMRLTQAMMLVMYRGFVGLSEEELENEFNFYTGSMIAQIGIMLFEILTAPYWMLRLGPVGYLKGRTYANALESASVAFINSLKPYGYEVDLEQFSDFCVENFYTQ